MTFIEQLKAHVGGLIRIKTELYWYKKREWDGIHERVCLLLDAFPSADLAVDLTTTIATTRFGYRTANATVLLFIDGAPKWVWVYENAMEFIE